MMIPITFVASLALSLAPFGSPKLAATQDPDVVQEPLEWMDDVEAAFERASAQDKPLLIYVLDTL